MRCHACFKINLKNETVFCNYCGNNSLIRTSVSVNGDGTLKVYLKHDFQYNNRGTIYSIPEPKGGRKCNDMVLRADQKEYVRALEVKKRNDRKENIDFDGDLLFGAKRDNVMPVIGYGKRNINQVTTGRRRK